MHRGKIYLSFNILAVAFICNGAWGGAYPKEADNTRQNREATELAQAQADNARAFRDFYQGLKSGKDPETLSDQILAPAQAKLTSLISDRHSTDNSIIYGRTYFPDGTSMDVKEYDKDRSKYLAEKAGSGASTLSGSDSGTEKDTAETTESPSGRTAHSKSGFASVDSGSGTSTGLYGDAATGGEKRADYQLDGNGVAKEIEFPGASKQPEPTRQPASIPVKKAP